MWLLLTCPLLGTWPTAQECALTGNLSLDTLVCRPASIHWATPARANLYFLIPTCLWQPSVCSLLSVVPSLFGTTDQFCGRPGEAGQEAELRWALLETWWLGTSALYLWVCFNKSWGVHYTAFPEPTGFLPLDIPRGQIRDLGDLHVGNLNNDLRPTIIIESTPHGWT